MVALATANVRPMSDQTRAWSDHDRPNWRNRSDHPSPDCRVTLRLDATAYADLLAIEKGKRSARIKELLYSAQDTAQQLTAAQQTITSLTDANAELRQMLLAQNREHAAQLAERDRLHSEQMNALTAQVSQLTALVAALITSGQNQQIVGNGNGHRAASVDVEHDPQPDTPPARAQRPAPAAKPAVVAPVIDDTPSTPEQLASATGNFLNMFG